MDNLQLRRNKTYNQAMKIIATDKNESQLYRQSIQSLQHKNPDVRTISLTILGNKFLDRFHSDPILVKKIERCLEDNDSLVKEVALELIIALPNHLSESFINIVKKLLNDRNADVQAQAEWALKKLEERGFHINQNNVPPETSSNNGELMEREEDFPNYMGNDHIAYEVNGKNES